MADRLFSSKNNLEVKVPVQFLKEVVSSVPQKRFSTVAMEFFEGKLRIRSFSLQNTEYLHLQARNDAMKITSEGYLIAPLGELTTALKKFGGGNVIIKWPHNEKITIADEADQRLFVEMPAREKTELPDMPEEDRLYPIKDGRVHFPLKDQSQKWVMDERGKHVLEACETNVMISLRELEKGFLDMEIANTDYVVYTFAKGGSSSSSGRYVKKGNESSTPIDANVSGEDCQVLVPDIVKDFIKGASSDNVVLQMDRKYPMFFVLRGSHKDDQEISVVFGIMQYTPPDEG